MKNILFLIMMYFISSNFAISQSACTPYVDPLVSACYNEGCSTDWDTYTHDIVTMDGCTIRVEICFRECSTTPHTTQWTINSISFLGNCDIEWDKISLTPGSLTINQEKWKAYKLNLVRTISLRDFQDWYNDSTTTVEMKSRVLCGSGYHAKVQYWEASCT